MIRPNAETRALWASLAATYRWLYGCSLQERLAAQAVDVADWFKIGGEPARRQRDLTAGPHTPVWPSEGSRRFEPPTTALTVAEPEAGSETSPLDGRPTVVRDVIIKTALQSGVTVERIMGESKRRADTQARRLCMRRLAALPWRGSHPSHEQIARWLGMNRSSISSALRQGA